MQVKIKLNTFDLFYLALIIGFPHGFQAAQANDRVNRSTDGLKQYFIKTYPATVLTTQIERVLNQPKDIMKILLVSYMKVFDHLLEMRTTNYICS